MYYSPVYNAAKGVWENITLMVFVRSSGLLLLVVGSIVFFHRILPVYFKIGWTKFIYGKNTNIISAPLELIDKTGGRHITTDLTSASLPVFTLQELVAMTAFFALVLFLIPFIAYIEEVVFRYGYINYLQAALMSVFFGTVHMLVGISPASAFAIMIGGFYLANLYIKQYQRIVGRFAMRSDKNIKETIKREENRQIEGDKDPMDIVDDVAKQKAAFYTTVHHAVFNSLILLFILFSFWSMYFINFI